MHELYHPTSDSYEAEKRTQPLVVVEEKLELVVSPYYIPGVQVVFDDMRRPFHCVEGDGSVQDLSST